MASKKVVCFNRIYAFRCLCFLKHILVAAVLTTLTLQLLSEQCDFLSSVLNIAFVTLIEVVHILCEYFSNGARATTCDPDRRKTISIC